MEPDPAEAPLIADLREAFGYGAECLCPDGLAALDGGSRIAGVSQGLGGGIGGPPGSRLADFQILGELGRGGMGVVYRARQVSLGREVALKVLPGYARHGPAAVDRFVSEAQAAARLHHTNIVSVYAQGEADGHYYYAMELIDGVGLDTVIRSRPGLLSSVASRRSAAVGRSAGRGRGSSAPHWPGSARMPAEAGTRGGERASSGPAPRTSSRPEPGEASGAPPSRPTWTQADLRGIASLLAEVAEALDHAHHCGVIHRDVKPHNLLLGSDQRLHLTDFGLARLTDAPHLTVTGEIMGTAAYLSPEQIRGDSSAVDHRTDIYSLGVTLYEVITGRKPFDAPSRDRILHAIDTVEPMAPRRVNPRLPVDLETICLRAMSRDRQQRHPTAGVLADDLRRFAEGRPILSRRVGVLTKAGKWIRRHRAASVAIAAIVAVVATAGGWSWSAAAQRQRSARELVLQAYEQCVYFDYRKPVSDEAALERAAAVGAAPVEYGLLRAMMCFGASRPKDAVPFLEEVLRKHPGEPRAWYLVAWAQFRGNESATAAAREALAEAEAGGMPTTADAWFFRGLALHFGDPPGAIEAYRRANELRAQRREFFPQAMRELARARNQQLYASRDLTLLPDIDAALRTLVEQKQYGAYPYYLLSIAHRLAAEVYRGSTGVRDDRVTLPADGAASTFPTRVQEQYEEALSWARRGQALDPNDERTVTAEAECLESMGRLAEAIDVRSRALEMTKVRGRLCESYHYRWRLYYWEGRLDEASADLAEHARCEPDSRGYRHFYPALVCAERDDMDGARQHARDLAADAPGDAQAVIWSATCLRLLGQGDEAQALLDSRAAAVRWDQSLVAPQTEEWVRALYEHLRGTGSMAELESLAERCATPWKLWGEACFHIGVAELARGDRTSAGEWLDRAYRTFDGEQRYTYHARLLLWRMEKEVSWPAWIALSWEGALDAGVGPALQSRVPARVPGED